MSIDQQPHNSLTSTTSQALMWRLKANHIPSQLSQPVPSKGRPEEALLTDLRRMGIRQTTVNTNTPVYGERSNTLPHQEEERQRRKTLNYEDPRFSNKRSAHNTPFQSPRTDRSHLQTRYRPYRRRFHRPPFSSRTEVRTSAAGACYHLNPEGEEG